MQDYKLLKYDFVGLERKIDQALSVNKIMSDSSAAKMTLKDGDTIQIEEAKF